MGPFSRLVFGALSKPKTAEVQLCDSATLFLGRVYPRLGPDLGTKFGSARPAVPDPGSGIFPGFGYAFLLRIVARGDSGNDVRRWRSMCETKTKCDGRLLQASYNYNYR